MATATLTSATFEETIASSPTLFVDFWAGWCGPCMRFGPVYEAASEKHPDVTFAKVDTDAEQQLSMSLEIQSIPTLMVFKEGTLVFRQPGALNAAQLDELIEKVRTFDVAAATATPDDDAA